MRLFALLALSSIVVSAAAPSPAVQLGVPGRSNSTPWLAAAGSFVAVAWAAAADGKGDVMIAISRDGGAVFGTPVRVNAREGEARVSGEIPPRVALQPQQAADGRQPFAAAASNLATSSGSAAAREHIR